MEPTASMAAWYADLTVAGSDSRKTAWRVLAAIALSRLDASREHTSRSRWTTRHCQPAPGRHAAMARTSPTWASLTTKRTPESPRSRSAQEPESARVGLRVDGCDDEHAVRPVGSDANRGGDCG